MSEATSSHPLADIRLEVSDFKGFGDTPSGFEKFRPINVIIGRNNTGKSALVDAVELCVTKGKSFVPLKHARSGKPFKISVTQVLEESSIRSAFPSGVAGGGIPGNHFDYGMRALGQAITRNFGPDWKPTLAEGGPYWEIKDKADGPINQLFRVMPWAFENVQLLRLAAERDVRPEQRATERDVKSNGEGLTNMIRSFINIDSLPRDEVEVGLLSDLNEVYKGDSRFRRISTREDENQTWEIFLTEDEKGDIRLSQSGSSLKSIFILLAMLRLVPLVRNGTNLERAVLAVEEPENNLHPALLRRLLNFLAEQRNKHGFTLLITTHSPVCIDWAARRDDSQILHVQHRSGVSRVRTAIGYSDSREILDDLDVRASDLLQANGVIWVEGPSDRIYLNRWIELVSAGKLKEGVHYTIMFYGGKVLSHFEGVAPDKRTELVSFLSLNRNAALLMDSDRHLGGTKTSSGNVRKPRMNIGTTKQRIMDELESVGALVWVTEGREIENYIPAEAFGKAAGVTAPTIGLYDQIPGLPFLSSFKENKIAIAHAVTPHLTAGILEDHLDLWPQLTKLRAAIMRWNLAPEEIAE